VDLISKHYGTYNRGRVPPSIMREIGFEDCDYISLEENWPRWKEFKEFPSLQLHVPCRDPLVHLMSQCNYKNKIFNCSADDLHAEINKCLIYQQRFSRELETLNNANIKCFNPIPIEPYLEYMSERLQRKRIESTYVHRSTNKQRNKDGECIWNEAQANVSQKVRNIMVKENDLYGWCEKCMGSKDDLLASK
jgi:hypothetical protein